MLLVDKKIKEYVKDGKLITDGYNEKRVSCISYELTIGELIGANNESVDLAPEDMIIVQAAEYLSLPNDITARISEKNSKMRMGLMVDGPQYFPGHNTNVFLRVKNISSNIITIKVGDAIANMIFEKLEEAPEIPYSNQPDASFQDERKYKGFGRYEEEYRSRLKSFEKVKEDIEGTANKIYGNVLTLMGIIIAIFSVISINYQAFTTAAITGQYIIAMNLSLTFCIAVLMGIILLLVNKSKSKSFITIYGFILAVLCVATIVFCLFIK